MIPQLKTAFCGCSVRTGTKIIGWFLLVTTVLQFILLTAVYGILVFTVSSTDDGEIGSGAIKLLHDTEETAVGDDAVVQGKQTLHSIMMILIGDMDKDTKPEDVGRQLKQELQAIFNVIFIILSVIFLLHVLFTSLLLVGAYKNKSGYVLFYVVISVISLVGYLPVMMKGFSSFNFTIPTLTGWLIQLYFTWVIYSFYRELRSSKSASGYPAMVMLLPGQKDLEGYVPPTATPNDYYYPQKK